MVSLNIFQYKDEVKRALLARKNDLDLEWDPMVASWLAYAFVCENSSHSLLLEELSQCLEVWTQREDVWQSRRNIGPLFFLVWLRKKQGIELEAIYAEKAAQMFDRLRLNVDEKFSPFRFPEQVFLIALGISTLERDELREQCAQILASQTRGALARQIVFIAALRELGKENRLPSAEPADVTDVLAQLWWAERYGEGTDKHLYWSRFEGIADTALLDRIKEFDTRRVLSEWELAMLYEALIRQTSQPDPMMLFDYHPLHPRIKKIAEGDFKKGNYFGAVFEACKVLEDYLKQVSDSTRIGVDLVKEVLGRPDMGSKNFSAPPVKINELKKESPDFISQLDEQRGFSSLVTGVFLAFRNPKGHQPKDKTWVEIDPYEALDQLVVISLVIKRLQKATGIEP
ncbi:TIGR02391 family protein [Limisphaera sp. 4302-co]|uniref:TIGR02391 family protein n=1 Tax=Limisphaera sp. 4302-co TaxID=3400417 RepID=UPI003C215F90